MKRIEGYGSKVFWLIQVGQEDLMVKVQDLIFLLQDEMVNAIQDGELDNVETQMIPGLNLECFRNEGVESILLTPEKTWEDNEEYQKYLRSYL